MPPVCTGHCFRSRQPHLDASRVHRRPVLSTIASANPFSGALDTISVHKCRPKPPFVCAEGLLSTHLSPPDAFWVHQRPFLFTTASAGAAGDKASPPKSSQKWSAASHPVKQHARKRDSDPRAPSRCALANSKWPHQRESTWPKLAKHSKCVGRVSQRAHRQLAKAGSLPTAVCGELHKGSPRRLLHAPNNISDTPPGTNSYPGGYDTFKQIFHGKFTQRRQQYSMPILIKWHTLCHFEGRIIFKK